MQQKWWKESVVYQIWPRSFKDSNGDGIGDLRGISQKLDYLKALGVDVVWLSPVYQSPNDDMGYDISNYQEIMEEFGTLADWEALITGLHERGLKLVMDLVVNHTSDEHPWFVEARKAKDNPYRDYYIWRPGKAGHEPNNWVSFFSGSAWQYDAATDEYYLHLFSTKQPDLNWENPQVRQAVFAMMRWWLDKGVDGFRMDVINLISKTPGFPDAPIVSADRYQWGGEFFAFGPRLLEFLGEMKEQVLSRYDILTVGEVPMATTERALAITHEETGALNMLFQFDHMALDTDERQMLGKWAVKPWSLLELKQSMTHWQKALENKGWNSLYLANHDQPRALSRFGDDGQYRIESAKLLATFLHTLQGTPYIYQGEEIGMTNVKFASITDYKDIETHNVYRELVEQRGFEPQVVMEMIYAKGRDNARTPMQWDASTNAGFTDGTPWIKVNPNYPTINVEQALADPNSIFYYYQQLLRLRKTHPILVYGTYDLILADHPAIYAYTRTLADEQLLVMLNFTKQPADFVLPATLPVVDKHLLISNYAVAAEESLAQVTLRPYEARVYQIR